MRNTRRCPCVKLPRRTIWLADLDLDLTVALALKLAVDWDMYLGLLYVDCFISRPFGSFPAAFSSGSLSLSLYLLLFYTKWKIVSSPLSEILTLQCAIPTKSSRNSFAPA